jgi:electron transport complex protein RnfG
MSGAGDSSARLIGTLAVAGMLAGVLLVGVYQLTRPMILANQAEALQRAVLRVVPGAAATAGFELVEGELRPLAAGAAPGEHPVAWAARDASGATLGYALAAQGAGFMDTIKVLYGYDPARQQVVGFAVLESRETPGLGDKIAFDPQFLANFKALAAGEALVAVKRGAKTAPHQVDCITGATISSKAVVKILNASLPEWRAALAQGGGRGER